MTTGTSSASLHAIIYIFDRHGKLIKQISPVGEGWDGNYNGQQQPGTDYWFRWSTPTKSSKKNLKDTFRSSDKLKISGL
jgi:gliding motility-associated-like protein